MTMYKAEFVHVSVLWRGCAGSLSGGAVSCNTCNAAIVERDIVRKPGVISSGEAGAALSTGGGTGRGVSGEWGRKTGFLIIRLHTSWTTSWIRVLASSGIRRIARFLIRLCKWRRMLVWRGLGRILAVCSTSSAARTILISSPTAVACHKRLLKPLNLPLQFL